MENEAGARLFGELVLGVGVQAVTFEAAGIHVGANTRLVACCQRLLTVFFECSVAYLSEARALFSFRPSARCLAISAPMRLPSKLRAKAQTACQRLLTLVQKASTYDAPDGL